MEELLEHVSLGEVNGISQSDDISRGCSSNI